MKSSSYIWFSIQTTACWTILSSSAAMPIGRCLPSGLGNQILFEGCARYLPLWTLWWRFVRFASSSFPYCLHVISSIPGAAFRFNAMYAFRSRSVVIWCIKVVNRRFLSLCAASRILLSLVNASPCLCVQLAAISSEFPLVTGLPSSASAIG
jgi:hypothetical protein